MNFKKIILILIFLNGFRLFAQDVHFSQFGQTPQLINPGASGVFDGKVRGILNYKTQWSAFGKAYKTYAASVDLPIFKENNNHAYFGLGINFYKDVSGNADFGNFLGSISGAGILPFNEFNTVSLGIQAGYGQYSANLSQLTWGSQFDGSTFNTDLNSNELFANQSSNYFDLGAGILYQFKNTSTQFFGSELSSFNLGIAGYHLNQPKQNFLSNTTDKIPLKIITQFSGTFDITGSNVAIVPSMFYATQRAYKEITPGMLLKLKFGQSTKYSGFFKQSAIYFGAHYRIKDAIIPQVYLEFMDYMIGISYDYNNSDLSSATGGNGCFEISLKYTNKPKAIQRASFK